MGATYLGHTTTTYQNHDPPAKTTAKITLARKLPLVTKAAQDTYTGVQSGLRRLFRKHAAGRGEGSARALRSNELLIVQDPDPHLDVALHLWTDTPHEAIRALADLDLDRLKNDGASTRQADRPRRVFWNQATKTWQILD
jgi:hypothetical protein